MALRVSSSVLRAIAEHAQEASPEECCGVLLGSGAAITAAHVTANVAADRRRHFELDPQSLVDCHRAARVGGLQVIGYYHSHPGGAAMPSAADQALASGDGRVWAIAGLGDVTFWRDDEAGFTPLSYTVADG